MRHCPVGQWGIFVETFLMSASRTPKPKPVLFYDGDCGFCQRSLRVMQRMDKKQRLQYEPLQSELARSIGIEGPNYESLVYWRRGEDQQLRLSSGTFAALRDIGGFARFLGCLGYLVPRPLRDAIYRWVAKNRNRFGSSSCQIGE